MRDDPDEAPSRVAMISANAQLVKFSTSFAITGIQYGNVSSGGIPMSERGEITQLLNLSRAGDKAAESRLMELLYSELRRLAAAYMRRERKDHSLQPTALLNEAYLRLSGNNAKEWKSRAHFVAIAAQA